MCAIAGIYGYRSAATSPDPSELRRIRDHMAARGPDGVGEWFSADGRIVLGSRRLSIIDLSDRAAQPMQTSDRKFVITFNGEIYNYRNLRSELETKGHIFRTQSDTEVLLHLYAACGIDMVHRLRGMFAFAIWDNEKQGLFLARDPYGIKPLYYADDGQTFRFASQVKALLAGGKLSRDADPAGWVGFYNFGSVPEPFTTYRSVHALPAGSTLWLDSNGSRPQYYARLCDVFSTIDRRESEPRSHGELIETVRAAVRDSVRAHMVSDVPVGLFLSAGVDSGSLLGLMRDTHKADIQAVTLAYEEYRGTDADEAPLATKCARQYGCAHTIRTVSESEFQEDLSHIVNAMDQPTIDGINTWFVSKAARELGLKAAISGLGGDELFGGYRSFRDIPRLVHLMRKIPGQHGWDDFFRRVMFPLVWRRNPKIAGLFKYGRDFPEAYFLLRGLFMPWEMPSVIHDPDFLSEGIRRLNPVEIIHKTIDPAPPTDFAKVACLEASFYMRNQLLRDTDWASMAHSLEVRTPYADVKLLTDIWPALSALPKTSGKRILADLPSSALPPETVLRLKTGFGTPVDVWLQSDLRLQDWRRVRKLATPQCAWARRWAYQLATSGRGGMPHIGLRRIEPTEQNAKSVIIFRIGSIGDTVCALPCFHQIANKFSTFERILLTDIPTAKKGAPVEAIIGNSGLVHRILYFPASNRTVADLLEIRRQIRRTKAKILVYVADRPLSSTIRDICFFYLCGIRTIIGAPLQRCSRFPQPDPLTGLLEHETERLARCLADLGQIDLSDRAAWDIGLVRHEVADGLRALEPLRGRPFVAINMGGKVRSKDWGDANWASLLQLLSTKFGRQLGVVFFGSADEWDRSEQMALLCTGPTLNLCGMQTPRQAAASLKEAILFIGHDSGPMHLASAAGVPCVAIFGNYNLPKRWHPYGSNHVIIHNLNGVKEISADEVSAAIYAKVNIHKLMTEDRLSSYELESLG